MSDRTKEVLGYVGTFLVVALAILVINSLGGCASGPICTGTEDEVKQCQEQMARARENRLEGMGNRR